MTAKDPAPSGPADRPGRFEAGDGGDEARLMGLRRGAGLVLAPALFLLVLASPMPTLRPEAHRLAAIMAAVITLWMTEALPMPLTALIGASTCVVLRVAPVREVFASFADPLIFLFIGSFILARALFLHRLDRRLSFHILSLPWIGARPGRILIAYGAVTMFISGWISNTATTAMMFPIGMGILRFVEDQDRPEEVGASIGPRYATGMMLMATFASSIGGLATPIGAAPNIIGLGFLRDLAGIEFPFLKWCAIGVPVAILLFAFLAAYLGLLCRAGVEAIAGGAEMLRGEKSKLGPWTSGQRSTLAACLVTVGLWIAPGVLALLAGESSELCRGYLRSIPEPVAALLGATLLFLLPGDARGARAITWDEAAKIDWGVVLLFGGGLTLGVLSFQTGLAEALGRAMTSSLPLDGPFALLCVSTVMATLVSEVTSNTASANMVVPVIIAIALAAGIDPLEPALGATFGSGLGFMLPVSTPCNAIVFGSGYVPLRRMVAYGLMLDLVGMVVIIAAIHLITPSLR